VTRGNLIIENVGVSEVPSLARKGALWSGALVAAQQVVRLLATMALARLLLPSDYGLVAMAAALTAFIQVFSDAGLPLATIQRENVTESQIHNLFWLNVAFGVALTAATIAVSPAASWFFARHELRGVVSTLGLVFLFGSPGAQPIALLRRSMRFKALAIVEVIALIAAAVFAVAAALFGAGYWALVVQSITGVVVRTGLSFLATGYRPRLPRLGVGTWPLITFGGYLAAYGILVYFSRNVDKILIGKIWGAEELGYYGRAYFLMLLPSQGDREKLGEAYRKAVQAVALIAVPAAVGIGFCSFGLVRLVYGPQWLPVGPILAWLAVAGATQPIYNSYGWLFTAVGDGKGALLWGSFSTLVLASAFGVGVRWGATGVAVAYAMAMGLALTVPGLFAAHRSARISFKATLGTLVPVAGATTLMTAVLVALGRISTFHGWPWHVNLIAKIVVGVFAYAVAIHFLFENRLEIGVSYFFNKKHKK
jgi:PST family polysaccharide transporter